MRVTNANIPGLPGYDLDPTNVSSSWLWHSTSPLDGTAEPWKSAPRGSLYWDRSAGDGTVAIYVKVAALNANADWEALLKSGTESFVIHKLETSGTTYFKNLTVSDGGGQQVRGRSALKERKYASQ